MTANKEILEQRKKILNPVIKSMATAPKTLFFIKNTEQKYIAASDNFLQLTKFKTEEEIIGLSDCEIFVDPKAAQQYEQKCRSFLETEKSDFLEFTLPYPFKSGEIGMFAIRAYRLYDDDGKTLGMMGYSKDVPFEDMSLRLPDPSNTCRAYDVDVVKQLTRFVISPDDTNQNNINIVLKAIGQHYNISRVYIYEEDSEHHGCSNTFAWYADGENSKYRVTPRIDYEQDIKSIYKTNLDNRGILHIPDVRKLPPYQRQFIESRGICSLLHCGIFDEKDFIGFIGFDDCKEYRSWPETTIGTLIIASRLLTLLIIKERNRKKADLSDLFFNAIDIQNEYNYIIDPETYEILFINKAIREGFGTSSMGQKCYKTYLGKNEPCDNCPAKKFLETGKSVPAVNTRPDGFTILSSASPIIWDNKQAMMMTCMDISEYQNVLKKEQTALLNSFTDAYLAIYTMDLKKRRAFFVGAKKSITYYMGREVSFDDAIAIFEENEFEPGEACKNRDFWDFNTVAERLRNTNIVSRDVHTKLHGWVRLNIAAYHRDNKGNVDKYLWMMRKLDLEKSKELDADKAAKERMILLNSLANIYITMYDFDLINKTQTELRSVEALQKIIPAQAPMEESLHKWIKMDLSPESYEQCKDYLEISTIAERLRYTNVISKEILTITSGWILTIMVALSRDEKGNVEHVLWMTRSINEQKIKEIEQMKALEQANDAAQAASKAKTMFLSNLSHDIRTPLNGILGMTRVAEENIGNNDKIKDCLSKIHKSSDHLLTLINDVLDLSRIENGKTVMAHEPMDLMATVDDCISIMKGYVSNRDLNLQIERETSEHLYVMSDNLHLRQILLNVISNSVKYTKDGGTITFITEQTTPADKKHVSVRFIISDTGIGMSDDFLKHIFEPFSQADVGFSVKGSGLGMAIVKEFVELLGGKINVTSRQNVGTSVTLEIPMELAPEEIILKQQLEAQKKIADIDLNGIKVLIVEDNELNMEIAQYMLSALGMEITAAHNGQEALDAFIKSQPEEFDVILMDCIMPIMNGYEATKAIRALKRPDAQTTPIIAMTANAFIEDINRTKDCGMNAHISKPIDKDTLILTVGSQIRKLQTKN